MNPFYGRRSVRALSDKQKNLLEMSLTTMKIGDFVSGKRYHLEIGFGTGDFLSHISLQNPDVQFIGCEPFINGVVSFLQKNTSSNVWLTIESIHDVIDTIPDGSLEAVYILFPDPWPKVRHQKRRIIQAPFLEKLRTKTKLVHAATDHPDYADHMRSLGFKNVERPEFFVSTKYETKRKAGDPQYFKLEF
jgi:tRNA (guanine-N7-)-methyltransferase